MLGDFGCAANLSQRLETGIDNVFIHPFPFPMFNRDK